MDGFSQLPSASGGQMPDMQMMQNMLLLRALQGGNQPTADITDQQQSSLGNNTQVPNDTQRASDIPGGGTNINPFGGLINFLPNQGMSPIMNLFQGK